MTAPIPDYSKVSLLLPLSGANNGTVFTDYSVLPKTVTRNGDTKTVTAKFQYYGSSAYFDGAGDYLSVPNGTDFAFGTGDFTVAAWVNFDLTNTLQFVVSKYNTGANTRAWSIALESTGKLTAYCSTVGTSADIVVTGATTIISGQWYHVALTRSGSTFRLFLNGVLDGSTTNAVAIFSETNTVTIGGRSDGFGLKGYAQDVLVVKGSALWTEDFTPPAKLIGSISTSAASPILDDTNAPASRRIVAFPRTYYQRLVSTTSAADGSFALNNLPAAEHTVVYLDDDAGTLYNDKVNRVIPG